MGWGGEKRNNTVLDDLWPHKGTEVKEELGRFRIWLNEVPSELKEENHGTMGH